jgi:hypothetical protein
MATTTSYGSWQQHGDEFALTVEDTIAAAVGGYAHDFDLPAIAAAYRAAINDALPAGVVLAGDDFIGPYPADDFDLAAVVQSVGLWPIIEAHHKEA